MTGEEIEIRTIYGTITAFPFVQGLMLVSNKMLTAEGFFRVPLRYTDTSCWRFEGFARFDGARWVLLTGEGQYFALHRPVLGGQFDPFWDTPDALTRGRILEAVEAGINQEMCPTPCVWDEAEELERMAG